MAKLVQSDPDVHYLKHEGIAHTTDRAVLYKTVDHGEVWIPKSMIEDEGDDLVGVKKWFAAKEGLT